MSHFRNRLLTLLVVCCRVSDDLSLVSCVPSTDPDYDKRVRPNEGVSHEKVEIGLFLNSIRTVSEADMTVVLDLFVQVCRNQNFSSLTAPPPPPTHTHTHTHTHFSKFLLLIVALRVVMAERIII